ncbi:MAG: nucleoside hydrolase [Anaerolineae bacterium]|nr:nucleoside hydrolase [Anaerolineae bacterium]
MAPKRTQIILDTDIGSDVDDALALSLILCSPELELVGVTCVYGDVSLRARMVMKLLALRGRARVPVATGARQPLLGLRPVQWAGHEGKGLLGPEDEALTPDPEHAVDLIVRKVMENPGRIHLAAIGPLTNVALAFLREPRLAQALAHLTIMGGSVRGPGAFHLPYAEYNIHCDPEAAHVVLSSGAPITLVPLDVTTQVAIRPEGVARIRAGGTPFHEAIARQVELYPHFASRGYTHLHDPLAVATVIRPDLVRLEPLHVDVEMEGRHAAGATLVRAPSAEAPANARVALGVEARRFEEFLVERLAG